MKNTTRMVVSSSLLCVPAACGGGGGATTGSMSCSGGGTWVITVTKSAARADLAIGDQATLNFSNCSFTGSPTTYDGSVKMTAKSNASNFSSTNFNANFVADFSALVVSNGCVSTNYSGQVDATLGVVNSNSSQLTFTVPAGRSYSTVSSGLTYAYSAGTSFSNTESVSPNAGSIKLDGGISAGTSFGTLQLTVATPSPLNGSVVSNAFVATTGVINTKDADRNPATSTTISGVNAQVSGDTDGNGTLDLAFSTTWASLVSGN